MQKDVRLHFGLQDVKLSKDCSLARCFFVVVCLFVFFWYIFTKQGMSRVITGIGTFKNPHCLKLCVFRFVALHREW
jgi:hypothetical protein